MCKNCGKYSHRASNFQGNEIWVNKNKNKGKHRFNEEFKNRGRNGHMAADCWPEKKDKEDDVDNLFVGAIFC